MTSPWEELNEDFGPYKIGGRTDSTAMLAWYLRNVERLDEEDISDFICDGNGDKGIDALVVNDSESEITVYQAKRMDSPSKTQGDKDLKHFVGTAQYFASEETVQGLLESKPRDELRRLLLRNDVQMKVTQGYRVKRLVYVTNALLDSAGNGYVDAMATQEPNLDVWDQSRLAAVAERVRREGMRPEHVALRATTAPIIDNLGGKAKLAVALIPAKELLSLPGIADMTLFSRNVRLSAGNTRINRELAETVDNAAEHDIFPAAHNGITMLTLGMTTRGKTIKLDSVSVVNGCQSMLALHKAEKSLSDSLKLLVKIVELPSASSDLSDTITYRANNQNAVNMRDQRSTDTTQLDLKRQVSLAFDGRFSYVIKTGEVTTDQEVLDNTLAAQLIVAVFRQRPWAAVRKVRLFDEDYHDVFKQDITAYSLRFLYLLNVAVEAARDDLKGELRSSFASVKFTLASLTTDLLRLSAHGIELINDPHKWLPDLEESVQERLNSLAREVVTHLNSYVDDQQKLANEQGVDFDAKTVFKSQQGVSPLRTRVTMLGRWMGDRDEEYLFNIAPA